MKYLLDEGLPSLTEEYRDNSFDFEVAIVHASTSEVCGYYLSFGKFVLTTRQEVSVNNAKVSQLAYL